MKTTTETVSSTVRTYYRVAVSNSHVIDQHGRFLRADLDYDCGHNHKTPEAAEACKTRLIGYDKTTRTCSARWYNSAVYQTDRNGVHIPPPAMEHQSYR